MTTYERVKELLSYNETTGVFTWLLSRGTRKKGSQAGNAHGNYYEIGIDGKMYKAHRIAWLYVNGSFPKNEIDHIDGNGKNNGITNLRDVTSRQNACNRKIHRSGKKPGAFYKKDHKKWMVTIRRGKIREFIGYFDKEEDALKAYEKVAK